MATHVTDTARAIREALILFASDMRGPLAGHRDGHASAIVAAVRELPDEAVYHQRERFLRLADTLRALEGR